MHMYALNAHLHPRLLLFEEPPGAGDGAAGAHARHKDIDLALGGLPDLGAGGLVVDLQVAREFRYREWGKRESGDGCCPAERGRCLV